MNFEFFRNLSPRPFGWVALALLGGGLSACSAIAEGTYQTISINTEPRAAYCKVSRDGWLVGEIQSTPGKISVTKNFSDLQIECRKPGYQESLHFNRSQVAGAAIVSVLLFGSAGAQIERDAGAIRKYDSEVVIPLVRPGEAPMAMVVVEPRGPNGGRAPRAVLTAATPEPKPTPPSAAVSTSTARKAATGAKPAPAAVPALPPAQTVSEGLPASSIDLGQTVSEAAAPPAQESSPLPTPEPLLASPPTPAPAPPDPYVTRRLENLKEIFDRKALTADEYERKRLALLAPR